LIGSVALAMILMRMKWELGKKEAAILVSAYALFISIVVIMA
jgi:Ca2+/Na+ antiporter